MYIYTHAFEYSFQFQRHYSVSMCVSWEGGGGYNRIGGINDNSHRKENTLIPKGGKH